MKKNRWSFATGVQVMRLSFIAAMMILFGMNVLCDADTINVPGDYPTIKDAIKAATKGDMILVDDGIYYENIVIYKNIAVKSKNGPDVTVIDGIKSGPVVIFLNNAKAGSMLEGFTIRNGHYAFSGGGIYIGQWCLPTIKNNIIVDNYAEGGGGGVYCTGITNKAIIDSNIINNNQTNGNGGGIRVNTSKAIITNNTITNNKAQLNGGGVYIENWTSTNDNTITNNTIDNNHAYHDGGGIYLANANATITSNMISNNIAESSGGGIMPYYESIIEVHDNQILNNKANGQFGGGFGGGILCGTDSVVSENVISGNFANDGGGGIKCWGNAEVKNNTISGNWTNTSGGGMVCSGVPDIWKNDIIGNLAGKSGGGIVCFLEEPSDIHIHENNIMENHVFGDYAYGGGGVCFDRANGEVYNNFICGNVVDTSLPVGEGGGILIDRGDDVRIYNNTIFGNSIVHGSNGYAGVGGGIYVSFADEVTISNTILWGNASEEGNQLGLDFSKVCIDYSDAEGGKDAVFVMFATLVWGNSMMDHDPMLVDPLNEDYHLTSLSPCINLGSDGVAPGNDIDGDPRPLCGTSDMGADEFSGMHHLEADSYTLSEAVGGKINMTLYGESGNGNKDYLVLATLSHNLPGTLLPGREAFLPLNWDLFTGLALDMTLNGAVNFAGFYGTLDRNGNGTALFDTKGPLPGFNGYTMSFAFTVLKQSPWDFASNTVNIMIIP